MQDFRIIKVAIGRSYGDVYAFLSDPRSFSTWGGADPYTPVVALGDGDWLVQIDGEGTVLRYSAPNAHGILDLLLHRPGEAPGPVAPVRLYPNRQGSELVYVCLRPPGQSDQRFASNAEWLQSDLLRLKVFLEKDQPPLPVRTSRVVGVRIGRAVDEVVRFFRAPRNVLKWTSLGASRLLRRGRAGWLLETPAGPRLLRFDAANSYGVLDYRVGVPGEEPVPVPMRAVASGAGTLLIRTVFARPEDGNEAFEWTVDLIATDLAAAASLLER